VYSLIYQEYGCALCSIKFLENRKPIDVFNEFLDSRKIALLSIFSRDAKKYSELQLVNILINFMQGISDALLSILSLFLATSLHSIPDSYLRGKWEERGVFYNLLNSISKDECFTGMISIYFCSM
jgi:hypothetical protein